MTVEVAIETIEVPTDTAVTEAATEVATDTEATEVASEAVETATEAVSRHASTAQSPVTLLETAEKRESQEADQMSKDFKGANI